MNITEFILKSAFFAVLITIFKATNCDNSWINYGKNCYFTNSSIAVTYPEANKICMIMDAEVLTFNSTQEKYLIKMLENKTSVWIQHNYHQIPIERSCSVIQANDSQILRMNVNCDLRFDFICEVKVYQSSVNEEDDACIKFRSPPRRKRYINRNFPFQNRFDPPFPRNFNSNPIFFPPRGVLRTRRPFYETTPLTTWRPPRILFPPEHMFSKGDHFDFISLHDVIKNHSLTMSDLVETYLKRKMIQPKAKSAGDDDIVPLSIGHEIGVSNNTNNSSDVPQDLSSQKNFTISKKIDHPPDISNEIRNDSSLPKSIAKENDVVNSNFSMTTMKSQISISTTTSTISTPTTTTSTQTTTSTTTTTTHIPTTTISKYSCRDKNHFKFYGICYYFDDSKNKTWEEARKSCSSIESSSLASFNSKYEYESVLMILNSAKLIQSEIWIGYHVVNQSSSFQWNRTVIAQLSRWVNGDQIRFPGWWQRQLDISEGFCGAASKDMKELWSLRNCQLELPYLCSYKTDAIEFFEEDNRCEFGWVEINGWCYKYYSDLKTWRDAEESCILLGGHLPSITNEKDEEDLIQFLCNTGPPCNLDPTIAYYDNSYYERKLTNLLWAGYFIEPNGSIIWADGLNSSYYQWNTHDAKQKSKNQYCGQTDIVTLQLANHTCNSFLPYVCKRKTGHFTNVIPFDEEVPIYCPNDKTMTWHRNGDRCYKVFMIDGQNHGKTFKEAMDSCNRDGAQLVSIESHEENYFVLSQLTQVDRNNIEVWIGGKRSADNGKFYWMKENITDFQYFNWMKGEPNNNDKMEDCVTIYPLISGQWNDDHCAKKHGWICERSLNYSAEYVSNVLYPSSGSCPPYWTKTDLKCVRLYSYEQRDYDKARDLCSKHHVLGDLVTIENVKQQALITALLAVDKKDVWIGLRELKDKFYWPDQNVILNFTNWGKHQRSYHRTCVALLTTGEFGKWSQTSCSANNGYVCQMPVDPKLKATNLFPFKTTCEPPYDSFFYFEGDCYALIERMEPWDKAEKYCQKLGAHLASVLLTKENSFLLAQFGNIPMEKIWIGLNRLQKGERFIWVDHWPPLFFNWVTGQPSEVGDKDCVTLSMENGTWSQTNCEELNFFVCKHSKLSLKSTELAPPTSCKNDEWMDFGGNSCYFMQMNEMPHDSAEIFCKSIGGRLASIHTHEEMNILGKLAEFVGISMWIGLKRQQDGAFHWNDESSSLTYVNWGPGEPNFVTEHCVEILTGSGLWNDAACNLLRIAICESPKENKTDNGLQILEETFHNNTVLDSDLLKVAKITRSNAGRIIGINLGLLVVILAVVAAGAFGYDRYRKRLLITAGGYGFDNVSYNLTNRAGPTNVVLGDDPLEHKYHEGEGILGDQSEDDESDGDVQTDSEKLERE